MLTIILYTKKIGNRLGVVTAHSKGFKKFSIYFFIAGKWEMFFLTNKVQRKLRRHLHNKKCNGNIEKHMQNHR